MSALVRLPMLYFTAFRTQRWLLIGGAALLLAAAVFLSVSVAFASIAAVVGASAVLLPVSASAGVVFRALSASSRYRFAPFFRCKMLAALLLLVGMVAVAAWAVAWLFRLGNPVAAPPFATLGMALLFCSMSVLGTFIISRSPTNVLLAVPLSYLVAGWVSEHGSSTLAAAGMSTGTAVWSGLVGIWVLFAVWYLTTSRVSPVGWNRAFLSNALGADISAQISRGAAVGLYLTGQRRLPAVQGSLMIMLWGVAITTALWLLNSVGAGVPASALLPAAFVPSLFCGALAYRIARRSRMLWLVSEQRDAVFTHTEAEALRGFLLISLFSAMIILSVAFLDREWHWTTAAGTIAFVVTTGLGATYLGLLYMTGPRSVVLAAGVLLMLIGFIGSATASIGPRFLVFTIVLIGLQLSAALIARALARVRWLRIDWSRLRPSPIQTQRLRLS